MGRAFFSLLLRVRAAYRGSLIDNSTLALRNARKTLGKERDCSQSKQLATERDIQTKTNMAAVNMAFAVLNCKA